MSRRRSPVGSGRNASLGSDRRSPRRIRPVRRSRPSGDAGAVLLEAAIAIPMLLAVALCLAWAVSLAATSLALGDVVRQSARDAARGVPIGEALDSARAAAPGALLRVVHEDDAMVVLAEQQVRAPGPVLEGISVTVTQRVAVPVEWSEGSP